MPYRIMVFNQKQLGQFSKAELLTVIKGANFPTLCRQYGLEIALIEPALAHLAVEKAGGDQAPYFLLRYQPNGQPPIIVTEWNRDEIFHHQRLKGFDRQVAFPSLQNYFSRTQAVYSVALVLSQLSDLGLLLAYELARWAAHQGEGIVLGLDGMWYRLNAYQAFIPIK